MPKFTLIAEHIDYTGVRSQKNTMEFDEEYLGDILNNVKQFLQGTGFTIDGIIDIVPDEFGDPAEYEEDFTDHYGYDIVHTGDEQPKSDYSFNQNFYKEVKLHV